MLLFEICKERRSIEELTGPANKSLIVGKKLLFKCGFLKKAIKVFRRFPLIALFFPRHILFIVSDRLIESKEKHLFFFS